MGELDQAANGQAASVGDLSLDDFIDGKINSLPPDTPGAVTFTTSMPWQEVMFGQGFRLNFIGHQYTHNHPKVIDVLRQLARRTHSVVEQKPEAVSNGTVEIPADPTTPAA